MHAYLDILLQHFSDEDLWAQFSENHNVSSDTQVSSTEVYTQSDKSTLKELRHYKDYAVKNLCTSISLTKNPKTITNVKNIINKFSLARKINYNVVRSSQK